MPDLIVELYGHRVGVLAGDDWRTFDFVTDPSAFEHFDVGAAVLSETVPFTSRPQRARAARRRNFFGELLPEGDALETLARRARVSPYDTLGMLRAYGRDLAGAIQIWDESLPDEPRTPRTELLPTSQIEGLLGDQAAAPLGNRPDQGKTSLAGVQSKIVLARVDDGWHQVFDGFPSTHILKPTLERHPTAIFDEEFGARLGRGIGVLRYAADLTSFGGMTALVIERYNRGDWPTGRLHQEDMNQALGVSRGGKYQEHSTGGMNLGRIAGILGNRDPDSVRTLLRLVVLAVAVGDLDMHGKNIGMLHYPDGTARIAPAYDIVPLAHREGIDGRMAMAINGTYPHRSISAADLIAEGASWGLRDAAAVVREVLAELAVVVAAEEPHAHAHPGLGDDVREFIARLLAGSPAGAPVSRA